MGSVPSGRSGYTADARVGSTRAAGGDGRGPTGAGRNDPSSRVQAGLAVPAVEPVGGVQDGGRRNARAVRQPGGGVAGGTGRPGGGRGDGLGGRRTAGGADGGVHR